MEGLANGHSDVLAPRPSSPSARMKNQDLEEGSALLALHAWSEGSSHSEISLPIKKGKRGRPPDEKLTDLEKRVIEYSDSIGRKKGKGVLLQQEFHEEISKTPTQFVKYVESLKVKQKRIADREPKKEKRASGAVAEEEEAQYTIPAISFLVNASSNSHDGFGAYHDGLGALLDEIGGPEDWDEPLEPSEKKAH